MSAQVARTIMRKLPLGVLGMLYHRTIMQTREGKGGAAAPPSALVVNDARALGESVRESRQRLNLDQRELAFAANVSPRTVFAIEKGKPTVRVDMLIRVLAAVGLKLSANPRDRVWRP